MKIISIVRKVANNIPDTFVLGERQIINNDAIPDVPTVSAIKFQETGYAKGQAYRGPCYIVSFTESSIKRIIPADKNIVDIAVEMTTKSNENAPVLPE
jgi:hypothetical protein